MAFSVRCWIVGAVSALSLAQFTWAADLASTNVVLERIGKGLAPTPTGLSEPAKLLNDINAFRSRSARLAVDQVAADWLILWDRAQSLDSESLAADYAAFDVETGNPVGVRSVIAALPAPPRLADDTSAGRRTVAIETGRCPHFGAAIHYGASDSG